MLILLAATIVTHMTAAQNSEAYEKCANENVYPVINNCRQYFKCLNGTLTLNTCPGIDEFSPIYNWCLPPKLAKCSHKNNQHFTGECINNGNIFPPSVQSQTSQYHSNNPPQESIFNLNSSSIVKPVINPEVEYTTPVRLDLSYNTAPKSKLTSANASISTTEISSIGTLKVGKVTTKLQDTIIITTEKPTTLSSRSQNKIYDDPPITQLNTRTSVENSTLFSSPTNPNLYNKDTGKVLNRHTTEFDNNTKKNMPVGGWYKPNIVANHSTSELITPTTGQKNKNYIRNGIFSEARKKSVTSPTSQSTFSGLDNSSTKLTTNSNFGLNGLTARFSLSTDKIDTRNTSVCNSSLESCNHNKICNSSSVACHILPSESLHNQSVEVINATSNRPLMPNITISDLVSKAFSISPVISPSKCNSSLNSCEEISTKQNHSSPSDSSHFLNDSVPNVTMSVGEHSHIVTMSSNLELKISIAKLTTVTNVTSITQPSATTEAMVMGYQNQTKPYTNSSSHSDLILKHKESSRNTTLIKWLNEIIRKLMANRNASVIKIKSKTDADNNRIWLTQTTAKSFSSPNRSTRISRENSPNVSTFPVDMHGSSIMSTSNSNLDQTTKKPQKTMLLQNKTSPRNEILLSSISSTEAATKSTDKLCDNILKGCSTNSSKSSTSIRPPITQSKRVPLTTANSSTCNPSSQPCENSLRESSTTPMGTITSDVNITKLPKNSIIVCHGDKAQSDPNNCKKFYLCLKNTLFHIDCPENTEFNPLHKWCLPTHLANCTSRESSLKQISIGSTTSSKPSLTIFTLSPQYLKTTPEDLPAIRQTYTEMYCKEKELYPNPMNCQQYYICENNTLLHRSCPGAMEFSFSYRWCMPAKLANCKLYTTTENLKKNGTICMLSINNKTTSIANSNLHSSNAAVNEVFKLPNNRTSGELFEESSEGAMNVGKINIKYIQPSSSDSYEDFKNKNEINNKKKYGNYLKQEAKEVFQKPSFQLLNASTIIEKTKYLKNGYGQTNITNVESMLKKMGPETTLINDFLNFILDSSEEKSSKNSYSDFVFSTNELSNTNKSKVNVLNHMLQSNYLTGESVSTNSKQSSSLNKTDKELLPIYMLAKPDFKVKLNTPIKLHPMLLSSDTGNANSGILLNKNNLNVLVKHKSEESKPITSRYEYAPSMYSVDKYKSILHSYFCYEKVSYPNPNDCTKYYKCKLGSLVSLDCPNGEEFSETEQKCLPADKASCLYKPLSNTDQEKQPLRRFGGNLNENHENYKTTLTPDFLDCKYYFECNTEICERKRCPDGLMFSGNERVCLPPNKAKCSLRTNTPTESNIDDKAIIRIVPAIHDKERLCEYVAQNPVYILPSSDCKRYTICFYGKEFEKTCPHNYEFSFEMNKCVSPAVSGCRMNYIRRNIFDNNSYRYTEDNIHKTKEINPYFQISPNDNGAVIQNENQDRASESEEDSLTGHNNHRYKRKSPEKFHSKIIELMKKRDVKDNNKTPQEDNKPTKKKYLQTSTSINASDDVGFENNKKQKNTYNKSLIK